MIYYECYTFLFPEGAILRFCHWWKQMEWKYDIMSYFLFKCRIWKNETRAVACIPVLPHFIFPYLRSKSAEFRTPHSIIASMIGSKVSPNRVRAYSERGGSSA